MEKSERILKKKLTPNGILAEAPDEKRIEIYDTVQSGLILRVTPKGSKSFAFRYWYDGKSTQRTIGSIKDYSLAEARAKAERWRKMLDEGKNPMNEKQENKEAITLGEYIEIFKNDYLGRKLKPSTQKTYNSRLNKIKEHSISRIPLKDLTRKTVREFLKEESKNHPTNANRLHSILSKMFNESIEDGYMIENPLKQMKKLTDEAPREVNYRNDDIKAIWEAFEKEWEPMQSLLKMLLITGQRLGETSKMKWSDIHNRIWTIPQTDTKNKSSHKVPLPNMALNLLKKLKLSDSESEFVFASFRDKHGHLTEFGSVIDRVRKTTMLNDFRLHDLRHIVATKMIDLDVPFIHVGKVLNHKGLSASNAITSRYVNPTEEKEIEQKTKALDIWTGELTELTTNLSLKNHG